MSRSGYVDGSDLDQLEYGRHRGRVASAIRGRRGQVFLRDLLAALDALPEPRLIANDLEAAGQVCALGALGKARGVSMGTIDPEDCDTVAATFGVATVLAQEVAYENDEDGSFSETPEQRFKRMRRWTELHLAPAPSEKTP